MILVSSSRIQAPTQMKDGSFRLSTGYLEPCSVIPPANQNKVQELITYPMTLYPNTKFKNPCPKNIEEFGSFGHELPILLIWPHPELLAFNLSLIHI